MANECIKQAAKGHGVHLWQIANRMGMADSAFSRKLRYELPADEQSSIIGIINELAGGDHDAADKTFR